MDIIYNFLIYIVICISFKGGKSVVSDIYARGTFRYRKLYVYTWEINTQVFHSIVCVSGLLQANT